VVHIPGLQLLLVERLVLKATNLHYDTDRHQQALQPQAARLNRGAHEARTYETFG